MTQAKAKTRADLTPEPPGAAARAAVGAPTRALAVGHAGSGSSLVVGVGTLFIEPGSPWENGYVESFNGKFRAELLDRELFDTLLEAQVLIERWRHEYNTFRPHSALGYRPPAPEAVEPKRAPGV